MLVENSAEFLVGQKGAQLCQAAGRGHASGILTGDGRTENMARAQHTPETGSKKNKCQKMTGNKEEEKINSSISLLLPVDFCQFT